MKTILGSIILVALLNTAFAAVDCSSKAVENAEAVSKIMFDGNLDSTKTSILEKNIDNNTYLIHTGGPGNETLNCNYELKMDSNSQGDCWMNSITVNECSA